MTWAELFDRAAAYGVDEAAVRAALAEHRAGDGGTGSSSDDDREAGGP